MKNGAVKEKFHIEVLGVDEPMPVAKAAIPVIARGQVSADNWNQGRGIFPQAFTVGGDVNGFTLRGVAYHFPRDPKAPLT
jgi:hypothetical protein